MKVTDVLRLELGNGIVGAWEIQGFYYGGEAQESVIELKALGKKPPDVSSRPEPYHEVQMFVPVNLIHKAIEAGLLTVYVPSKQKLERELKQEIGKIMARENSQAGKWQVQNE